MHSWTWDSPPETIGVSFFHDDVTITADTRKSRAKPALLETATSASMPQNVACSTSSGAPYHDIGESLRSTEVTSLLPLMDLLLDLAILKHRSRLLRGICNVLE